MKKISNLNLRRIKTFLSNESERNIKRNDLVEKMIRSCLSIA